MNDLRQVTKIDGAGLSYVEHVRMAGARVEAVSWSIYSRDAMMVPAKIAFEIRKRNPRQVRVSGRIEEAR